ncbi:hypothetical protein EB796_001519 [Bugula neritina]|uniref:Uncharacterized protein n=1 Tax=Bugula neritina TaxID=10212 RepID=A0A7J7KQ54_BUGNE|nr:hypothetical protein EB796_001519 [Bugula neritina]
MGRCVRLLVLLQLLIYSPRRLVPGNARILSAPNGYPNPDTFTWDSYTQETNSRPAPREAFQTVSYHPSVAAHLPIIA